MVPDRQSADGDRSRDGGVWDTSSYRSPGGTTAPRGGPYSDPQAGGAAATAATGGDQEP